MDETNSSRDLQRLSSLPLDERGEALAALIDDLEEELNSASVDGAGESVTRHGPEKDGSPSGS